MSLSCWEQLISHPIKAKQYVASRYVVNSQPVANYPLVHV